MFARNQTGISLTPRFLIKAAGVNLALALSFMLYAGNRMDAHREAALAPEINYQPNAIAVLSGGEGRIKEAVDLLQQSTYDTRLLVSGAHPDHTDPYKLLDHLEYSIIEQFIAADRIDVRANAINTQGNALEIEHWSMENPQIKNLLVVTSTYHIPRAQLELARVLPDNITVRYHGVDSDNPSHLVAFKEVLKVSCRDFPGCSTAMDFVIGRKHLREAYDAPGMNGQN